MNRDRVGDTGDSERRPERLLILTDDLGGGTGNHLLDRLEHAGAVKWTTELVSFEPLTARRDPSVPFSRLPAPGGPSIYPVHQVRRLAQVRDLVRDREPDLVHAYFFWPILYARLLRASGYGFRLVENREDEGFNWGRQEYFWLRLTRTAPDRVICVSEAVREVVVERERLNRGRTEVIYNGVREPPSVPRSAVEELRDELAFPANAPVVGMVANLNRAVKGVDRFLDAVPGILNRAPDARFVVVGGGEDEAPLRAKVREMGLEDRVRLPGYREDVHTFYDLMDVSVLTSHSEGLSITLLESMSHGLPVVATRVGGNPEVIVDGRTGFLVSPRALEELADRVVTLLGDDAVRSRMGEAAVRRARERFAMSTSARRYQEQYRELIGGPNSSRSQTWNDDAAVSERPNR